MIKFFNYLILGLIGIALVFAIHFNGTGVNQIYLAISCLLLLTAGFIALYIGTVVQKQTVVLSIPVIVSIVWIMWLFTSTLWSQTPGMSWTYCWITGSLPFGFLLGILIKPVCNEKTVCNMLIIIVLAYAGLALTEFLQNAKSTHGPMIYQGNFAALFPTIFMPLCASYIAAKNRQLIYLLCLTLLLLALFSTYSRVSYLSYLLVLPLLIYSAYRQGYAVIKPIMGLTVITVISYGFIAGYSLPADDLQAIEKTMRLENAGSTGARLMLWQSMLEIFKDYPWTGTGLASFKVFYPQYRNPDEVSSGMFGHNDYLQFLAEGGVIQLTFLLLPLVLITIIYVKAIVTDKPDANKLTSTALALGSATLFIHAGADFIFYNQALALLAGLLLAMAYHADILVTTRPIMLEQSRLIMGGVAVGLLLLWGLLAIDTYIVSQLEKQEAFGKVITPPKISAEALMHLHELDPKHLLPLTNISDLYYFMSEQEQDPEMKLKPAQMAIDYTQKILTLSPRYYYFYFKLAGVIRSSPELKPKVDKVLAAIGFNYTGNMEEMLLKQALHIDPTYRPASIALAEYYQQTNQTRQAQMVLKQASRWFNIVHQHSFLEQYQQDKADKLQIEKMIRSLNSN